MKKEFSFKQKECLRLLKDYATYFAMDERYAHECVKHDDKDACELHDFALKRMEEIKEQAEACGWTATISVFK